MGGDLEDAVAARVDDDLAGGEVLRAEALDDLGTGGGDVADAVDARDALEGRDELGRKSVHVGAERRVHAHACELPVPGERVLRGTSGRGAAEGAVHGRGSVNARERADRGEAERREVGDPERSAAIHGARGDVTDRVRAGVAEVRGVRHGAHAERVRHYEQRAPGHQ